MATESMVSSLVPDYNSADFPGHTRLPFAQTYYNFEVLISVEVCDDDTAEFCQAHSRRDPRFRVICHHCQRLATQATATR